ncbi:MAG: oxygen-independent coproporphyrinogen III oxidase [Hyphomicrobium sp.]|nr:oxygen-independent coproporphyrinogen III oxidase [Hyphomicrobium sp.]
MTPDLIQRHAAPLPRYTSYPTANHFSAKVTAADYRGWLADLPEGAALSLYLHIPFCKELCWYCGCSTKAVHRYDPVADYMQPLGREIETISGLVPAKHRVTHIHWGGGSPDILKPDDILRLGRLMREKFVIDPGAEIAVEIDPRLMTEEQAHAFADIGINRVSIGVQDFDVAVQRAIGRMQSYETTAAVVEMFRRRGVTSINIDLVYGLPHQTVESCTRTLEQVISLNPDRIAIFGYAHLPERLKHQRLIDEKALPGVVERFAQSSKLSELLIEAGYTQLGLDHFARAADSLATKALARNFQGYTTDAADALIGFGASAISRLPQGFAQNSVPVDEYFRRVSAEGVAIARGHCFTSDDTLRAYVIERLMCDFAFSWDDLVRRFGERAESIRLDAEAVVAGDADHLVDNSEEAFRLTSRGKVLVRNVCAAFDAYLTRDVARRRHALSV